MYIKTNDERATTDIYRKILENTNINLIASGGITSLRDIDDIRKQAARELIGGCLRGKTKQRFWENYAKKRIPCPDIRDGRTVKGINFIDIRDAGDPVELQKFIHQKEPMALFFDITATLENRKRCLPLKE